MGTYLSPFLSDGCTRLLSEALSSTDCEPEQGRAHRVAGVYILIDHILVTCWYEWNGNVVVSPAAMLWSGFDQLCGAITQVIFIPYNELRPVLQRSTKINNAK